MIKRQLESCLDHLKENDETEETEAINLCATFSRKTFEEHIALPRILPQLTVATEKV